MKQHLRPIQLENGTWHIEGLQDWRATYDEFCELISDNIAVNRFKFARYGDGEFNCMLGRRGHNCDYHNYYPDLGRDLLLSTMSGAVDDVITGIQPLSLSQGIYNDLIDHLFSRRRHLLVNADVFHNASITGRLGEFMDILLSRPQDVILVGNEHFEEVKGFDMRKVRWLQIHRVNSWLNYEDTRRKIAKFDEERDGQIFILCAGMMSEVIIHQFAKSQNTFIDLGSVLDPYCGVKSRKYHHKLNL
jgi:hypothetical protein